MNLQQVLHLLQTDNQLNDLEQKTGVQTLRERKKPKSMVHSLAASFIPSCSATFPNKDAYIKQYDQAMTRKIPFIIHPSTSHLLRKM